MSDLNRQVNSTSYQPAVPVTTQSAFMDQGAWPPGTNTEIPQSPPTVPPPPPYPSSPYQPQHYGVPLAPPPPPPPPRPSSEQTQNVVLTGSAPLPPPLYPSQASNVMQSSTPTIIASPGATPVVTTPVPNSDSILYVHTEPPSASQEIERQRAKADYAHHSRREAATLWKDNSRPMGKRIAAGTASAKYFFKEIYHDVKADKMERSRKKSEQPANFGSPPSPHTVTTATTIVSTSAPPPLPPKTTYYQ